MQTAELDARLSRQAEAGEGLTALMRTPLEHNIDHSVQLVLATEHATICSRDIAGGLFPAARVHAVLVANVHHTILNVVLAVQPSLFSWMVEVGLFGTVCICAALTAHNIHHAV